MSVRRDEEELLRLLLDREAGTDSERTAGLLEAGHDPEAARVLARFTDVLGRARTLDRRAEWSSAREKALIKRILANTTRQDLRWRGDLKLVVDFVGQRLRSSPALRALAASIVISVLATSFFAWMAIRQPDTKPYKIGFEIPGAGDVEEGEGEGSAVIDELELVLPEIGELTDAERRAWRIENALKRDRFLLGRWEAPASQAPVAEGAPLTVRLLVARAAWLDAAAWPEWIETEATLEAAVGLDRVLLAELLLDRFAGAGTPSALLPRTLHRLSRETLDGVSDDALVALGRRALDRARAYGRWEPDDDGETVAGFAPRPLDDEWYALLARALPAELVAHPALAAWLR